MSSEKFPKVLKDDFKAFMKFFRKFHQFFISTFLMTKCLKSRRIWGMSRAEKCFDFMNSNLCGSLLDSYDMSNNLETFIPSASKSK